VPIYIVVRFSLRNSWWTGIHRLVVPVFSVRTLLILYNSLVLFVTYQRRSLSHCESSEPPSYSMKLVEFPSHIQSNDLNLITDLIALFPNSNFLVFFSSTPSRELALLKVALWVIPVECFSQSQVPLLNPPLELGPCFWPSNLVDILSKSNFLTHSCSPPHRELVMVERALQLRFWLYALWSC